MKDRTSYPIKLSDGKNSDKENLEYWLSRDPRERINAIELLREQFYILQGYKETPRIIKEITFRDIR